MNKQQLLDTIQNESREWEQFLGQVGEERMELPGATGKWSFKDVVAHLSTWQSNSLERLQAARYDMTPSAHFWPAGWDEENDHDLQKINNWIYEENCDRTLRDVLNESRQHFRELSELVRGFSDEQLFDPNRFVWMEGKPLADLVSFSHFHEEHEPTLRQWLASQPTTVQRDGCSQV